MLAAHEDIAALRYAATCGWRFDSGIWVKLYEDGRSATVYDTGEALGRFAWTLCEKGVLVAVEVKNADSRCGTARRAMVTVDKYTPPDWKPRA